MNTSWCINTKTVASCGSPDLEYMTVPWEFTGVVLTAVYIPLDATLDTYMTLLAVNKARILRLFTSLQEI